MLENAKKMDIDSLNSLLDRNIGFINNCDTKTSIGLAVNGVMMSSIIATMNDSEKIDDAGLFFIPLMMLIAGAACFVYTLWARYEQTEEQQTILFWDCTSITKEEKEKLASLDVSDLADELRTQIVINAKLAKLKYEWYNAGLLATIVGSVSTILITVGCLIGN